MGDAEQRLYALGPLARDAARERAALSFTETVTRLSETHVPVASRAMPGSCEP